MFKKVLEGIIVKLLEEKYDITVCEIEMRSDEISAIDFKVSALKKMCNGKYETNRYIGYAISTGAICVVEVSKNGEWLGDLKRINIYR